jgi:two-component system response regulator YesN
MAKILILEDRLIIAHTIGAMIESAGHEASAICQKPGQALEEIKNKKPNLILLDLGLDEEKSGADVLKEAREQGFTGKVVFLSAYPEEAGRETIGDIPYDGYLVKPVTEEQLKTAIEDILNGTG